MNSQLAIAVLIDVEAALRAGSLHGHAYLVDNNRFMGSTGQGSEQLTTTIVGTQIMNWLSTGLDISGQQPFPLIEKIGGEAVDKQIMVPLLFDSPALDGGLGLWWGASVDANVPGRYSYTLYFDIGGRKMELLSSIDVQADFTMDKAPARAATRRKLVSVSVQAPAFEHSAIVDPANHLSLLPKNLLGSASKLRNK